nr:ABC transporter ATP-binding protein [uncultured Lachnoclostridium sp.]
MAGIQVNGLTKQFFYSKKEVGMKNSFKKLFHAEKEMKEAVKDLSFEVEQGEIVGFLGPNGAGKTTTLKMLSGILFPTNGTASVLGYTPWERKNEFKRQISIVLGQKNQLWWDLPANESLYLNKCIYKISDQDYNKILDELCEILDVKELLKVQVRELSLGERMKMELIAALLHQPKVLFLDEPTIGLDLIAQKKIREFLKIYNEKQQTTILLTSHYMDDIEDLCNRTIVINHGMLVYDASIHDINQKLNNRKIVSFQFNERADWSSLSKFGELKKVNEFEVQLEVGRDELQDVASYILKQYKVKDFNVMDIPLEESIEKIYRMEGMCL